MKTWLVSSIGCRNYSRVEAIQGRKLFGKIWYFKELFEVVWRCHSDHFCLDNDHKLWDPFFLSQWKWFQLHQNVLLTLSCLVNRYAHLFFLREKKTSLVYVKHKKYFAIFTYLLTPSGYKRGKSLLVFVTWNLKPKIDPHFYAKNSLDIFLTKFGNSGHVVMETNKMLLNVAQSRKVIFHYHEHFLFRWKELRILIWHIFWEIRTKTKNLLRLSHL